MSDSIPSEEIVTTDTPELGEKRPLKFRNSLNKGSINERVPWIIEGLISEGEQMLVFGPPKVGKSQFALQMGVAVALGTPFLNWDVGKQRNVLYVNLEIGDRQFMRRLVDHVMANQSKENGEPNGGAPSADGVTSFTAATDDSEPSKDALHENIQSTSSEVADTDADQGVTKPDSEPEFSDQALDEIDNLIEGRFFFSEEMRSIGISKAHIVNTRSVENDMNALLMVLESHGIQRKAAPVTKPDRTNKPLMALLSEWHAILDVLKPELIIFDTLSKMHELDERENSAIQGVIMLIRRIATVVDKSVGNADKARKCIAHVIVHHARKSSDDGRPLRFLSLDAIRGGSAIRAEADVIMAINGSEHPKDNKRVKRMIGIEARNIAGDEFHADFDGLVFRLAEPESDIATDQKILNCFKESRENKGGIKGVRGISIGMAAKMHSKSDNKRSKDYENSKTILSVYAENSENMEYILKQGNEALTAKWPVAGRKLNGKGFYWIRDGSPWLQDPTIVAACAAKQADDAGVIDSSTMKAAKKAAKKVPRVAGKKVAKKAPKVAGKKAAKKVSKEVAKKVAKVVPRVAGKKAAKRVTKVAGKKAAKKVSRATSKKTAKKAPRVAGKKAAKRVTKVSAKKAARNPLRTS